MMTNREIARTSTLSKLWLEWLLLQRDKSEFCGRAEGARLKSSSGISQVDELEVARSP
jgi:hypothetical protein